MLGVQLNDGTGHFAAPVSSTVAVSDNLQLADMDGDGDLDIVASNTSFTGTGYTYSLTIGLNDGLGNFRPAYSRPGRISELAVGDVGFGTAISTY